MRLSICIPTYNRGPFIGHLLDSILQQVNYRCELEVVISDNASSDDTRDIVERYRDKFDCLVYERAGENKGADRNFLKVVELASGNYCWLMGSDDILEPGAISTIEKVLESYPEVGGVFTGRNCYDSTITSKVPRGIAGLPAQTSLMHGAETIFLKIGEHIGYISGNVVNRALWNEVVSSSPVEEYFNAWVHVYVMARMMQQCGSWMYVADPCVGWRSGNDSFLADGQYKRLEIDVVGYSKIAGDTFGIGTKVYRHTMNRILRHVRFRVIHSKAHNVPKSFFVKTAKLLNKYYKTYPSYWITVYPIIYLPNWIFLGARHIYAKTIRRHMVAKVGG